MYASGVAYPDTNGEEDGAVPAAVAVVSRKSPKRDPPCVTHTVQAAITCNHSAHEDMLTDLTESTLTGT